MDFYNLNDEINNKLCQLRQKEEYVKKQEYIQMFNHIYSQIAEKQRVIDEKISSNCFEEATDLKEELSRLESQKQIMLPMYEKYQSQPEYSENDLISIARQITNNYDAFMNDIQNRQIELLKEALELQNKLIVINRNVEEAVNRLISYSPQRDFKHRLKYPRVQSVKWLNVILNDLL